MDGDTIHGIVLGIALGIMEGTPHGIAGGVGIALGIMEEAGVLVGVEVGILTIITITIGEIGTEEIITLTITALEEEAMPLHITATDRHRVEALRADIQHQEEVREEEALQCQVEAAADEAVMHRADIAAAKEPVRPDHTEEEAV